MHPALLIFLKLLLRQARGILNALEYCIKDIEKDRLAKFTPEQIAEIEKVGTVHKDK
jgi:hypothetical protein